MSIFLVADL